MPAVPSLRKQEEVACHEFQTNGSQGRGEGGTEGRREGTVLLRISMKVYLTLGYIVSHQNCNVDIGVW